MCEYVAVLRVVVQQFIASLRNLDSRISLKKKKKKIERLESKTPPLLRWRFRQQHAQELRMKAGWSIFKTRTGSCHNNLRRRTYLFAFLNQKQPIPSIHRILTHMFDHLSTVCSFSKLQQVFLFVQEVLNPINCCFPCVPSLCIVLVTVKTRQVIVSNRDWIDLWVSSALEAEQSSVNWKVAGLISGLQFASSFAWHRTPLRIHQNVWVWTQIQMDFCSKLTQPGELNAHRMKGHFPIFRVFFKNRKKEKNTNIKKNITRKK